VKQAAVSNDAHPLDGARIYQGFKRLPVHHRP
jgi:hypothetical protein